MFFRHNSTEANALKKYFISIEESFQAKDGGYLVGIISLEQIDRIKARNNPNYSFVLFGIAEGYNAKHYQREPEIELRELFIY